MAIFGQEHPRTLSQGAYERVMPTDFKKQREEKNLKKIDFYV